MDFEKCFSDFLDRREYDKAATSLFQIVRVAFRAGWLAAGGAPLEAEPVVQLLRSSDREMIQSAIEQEVQ